MQTTNNFALGGYVPLQDPTGGVRHHQLRFGRLDRDAGPFG